MMKKLITTILVFILLNISTYCLAQTDAFFNFSQIKPKTVANVDELKAIPILDNGRIKPLETYAKNTLIQFSGRSRFEKKEAINWLSKLIFAPESARYDKVFLINHPGIATSLGILPEKKRRYSFSQLQPKFEKLRELSNAALNIDPKERDIVENEIIRLYQNMESYAHLSICFSFAFPHPDFAITDPHLKEALGFKEKVHQFSFLEVAQKADELQVLSKPLETLPEDQWSETERQTFRVISSLFDWSLLYRDLSFTIIPTYQNDEKWISPWDAIGAAVTREEGRQEYKALRELLINYWNDQQLEFDLNARLFKQSIYERLTLNHPRLANLVELELIYNRIKGFFYAQILYFVVFLLFFIFLIFSKNWLYKILYTLLISGFVLHAVSIVMRIIILQRPPVSNLYETFIFVSFICVLTGLIIERIQKNGLGFIIAAVCGYVFLAIGGKFSAEGDTLQMLVAVLNSNFWLGTHVLSITTGYSGVCVAGIVGHVYLIQCIVKPQDKTLLNSTYKVLIGSLGFGLTMTFLGTNLGGIWADQSWGRFWGWDPKENGALLIILWIAILFHAKIGKIISQVGLAAGSALGLLVVMWAWFGVNLLSVGLHSYGFTSGLATNLSIYAVCQILIVIILTPLANKRLKVKG